MNDSEIRKMINFAVSMSIATNPAPEAIFDPLAMGVNIWATPDDHPKSEDWEKVKDKMDKGAYTKKCAFVGTVWYNKFDDVLEINTSSYILKDHLGFSYKQVVNIPADLKWCEEKMQWFFEQIGIPCPAIKHTKE